MQYVGSIWLIIVIGIILNWLLYPFGRSKNEMTKIEVDQAENLVELLVMWLVLVQHFIGLMLPRLVCY